MQPINRQRATDLLQRTTSRVAGRELSGRDAMIMASAVGAVALVALVAIVATIASIANGSSNDDNGSRIAAAGECQVSPRSRESLVAAVGTPAATEDNGSEALPTSVSSESDLPKGDKADSNAVKGITATVDEFIACLNAGEYLRAYALVTNDYLRREFDGDASTAESFAAAMDQTPTPAPAENRLEVVDIRDARKLDGGRVGAVVVGRNGQAGEETASFIVFVKQDDRWLIDGSIEIEPETSSTATP